MQNTTPTLTRPNLLLICTDQQRWDALSLYGTAGYRTPNLDRLARQGVAFDHGYTPSPVCTPARVSMITGLYPPSHGAFQIGTGPVPALDRDNLPQCLSRLGYATALFGKTHFVPISRCNAHVADRPIKEAVEEGFWDNYDGPYIGFDFIRQHNGHTCNNAPDGHYRAWLKRKGADLAAIDGLHWPTLPRTDGCPMTVGRWELPHELSSDAFITEESTAWIGRQERPWFAMLNYQNPHAPLICPEPFYSAVDMANVPIPSAKPGEMDNKPPFYKSFVEGGWYADEHGNKLQDEQRIASHFLYNFGEHEREAIRAYIGMVNMLDHYIGKVLDALEAQGQLDNTLICFVSDHGEMLGRHGVWEKGILAYDDCQRIPAILHWPASPLPEHGRVPHHFNLVDILPTFVRAAGGEIPVGVQGFDHLRYLQGDASAVRDWSLIDFHTSSRLHQQTFVTNEWKLVLYRDQDWGELYDRRSDPEQFHNLYHQPEHRDTRDALTRKLLQANMQSSGRPGSRPCYA